MKFSESWLRTLVDPPIATEELCHRLTMAGLEVEECEPVAPPFSGVVVAQVREVAGHPNADRLTVCQVDVGGEAPLSIVCGAPNVAAGMKVPCALVGAMLPGGFEIKLAQMRGVESQGMLCSARELGLSEDHAGLLALPADAPVGADFRALARLDDHAITIKLTPNRADCLSVLGVAREVAALTEVALTPVDVSPVPASTAETFPVTIADPSGCGRFAGRVIRDVNAAAPTPAWMRERLGRAGQRSISALVDVTNYVMLELGRPLHVYDLAKLSAGIDVRFGRVGETLRLLNEQTVEVYDDVLAITDASGPIGLAGIMGGDSTKATTETRHIFLESAFFFPQAIAGRARRYNFASDASHRFERGVDFANCVDGIERATRLILDICGGEAGSTTDTVAALPERRPVRMRVARAHRVIGVAIPASEMAAIFARLGLSFAREGAGDGEVFVVTPPSWRFDLEIEEDLIEEVARVYGFERIPARPPVAPALMLPERERCRSLHAIRECFVACDYHETINYSFVEAAWEADFAGNDQPIRLLNPIASQMSVMRSTLIGSLVGTLGYNLNRTLARVRLFEVGRVFLRAPGGPAGELAIAHYRQPMRVGGLAFGPALPEQWGEKARLVDFFDVKADVEALLAPRAARFVAATHAAFHPGRSARVELDGAVVGWLGELHPRWQQKYDLPSPPVIFELDAGALQERPMATVSAVSRFQPVRRDLAVVVADATPLETVIAVAREGLPAFVQGIELFDVYRGAGIPGGKKSLAFRVLMQDTERTLTDGEVDAVIARIVANLAARLQAELRI